MVCCHLNKLMTKRLLRLGVASMFAVQNVILHNKKKYTCIRNIMYKKKVYIRCTLYISQQLCICQYFSHLTPPTCTMTRFSLYAGNLFLFAFVVGRIRVFVHAILQFYSIRVLYRVFYFIHHLYLIVADSGDILILNTEETTLFDVRM